jgi:hypothetical protein
MRDPEIVDRTLTLLVECGKLPNRPTFAAADFPRPGLASGKGLLEWGTLGRPAGKS